MQNILRRQGGTDVTPVDFNSWTEESYAALADTPPAEWTVSGDGLSVNQEVNTQPTLFYGEFLAINSEFEGTIQVAADEPRNDDDFIGFAVGFQPGDTTNASADFLLIDWKRAAQAHEFEQPSCTPGSNALPGLAVSHVFGIPTADELWGHTNFDSPACSDLASGVEELARGSNLGSVGWIPGQEYRFRFEFSASYLKVFVDDVLEIYINGQFTDGRFAFYNFSQPQVNYSAFQHRELLPDLVVTSIDASSMTGDWQSLDVAGAVSADIVNVGEGDVVEQFTVTFFEDLNFDRQYEPGVDNWLGEEVVDALAAGATETVEIDVSTNVLFRNNLVYVFADSDEVIPESVEANNYGSSGALCEQRPMFSEFDPIEEWAWTASSEAGFENSLNVIMSPLVADVTGGAQGEPDGIPDVLVVSTPYTGGSGCRSDIGGQIRVLDGATGAEHYTVTDPDYFAQWGAHLAVGDIDGDGLPEIVALGLNNHLIVIDHDGTPRWRTPLQYAVNGIGAPALGDLDPPGVEPLPEIVLGRQAFDGDGTPLWLGIGGSGATAGLTPCTATSFIVDVDLDGTAEVVSGQTVFDNNGTAKYTLEGVPDGFTATANFDDDPYPEIVHIYTAVTVFEHDGSLKTGPVAIPDGGEGGPPTIADYDGDGMPEIGVAARNFYYVFEADLSVKWSAPVNDNTSRITGSTVFDFEGDGAAEVVYHDQTDLYIYRGTDGASLLSTPVKLSSCTGTEFPIVADVDADGAAEIIAIANNNCGLGSQRGVFVFGDVAGQWVNTRRVWNQHAYFITNVNDDLTIPSAEDNKENWLFPVGKPYNSFRQNILTKQSPLAAPDLTASYLRFSCDDEPAHLTGRIGNGGAADVEAGVLIFFYDGDPASDGTLIGTVDTATPLAPGTFEDVILVLPPGAECPSTAYVVADDMGDLSGSVEECDEENNVHSARIPRHDLTVEEVEVLAMEGDWQTLGIEATVAADIANVAGTDVNDPFVVTFFEDLNFTGRYELGQDNWLGEETIGGLAAETTTSATIEVATTVLFRDNLIYAFVDSADAIAETIETNNYAHSGLTCRGFSGPGRTYTLDADFDEGILVNVNHEPPHQDQLRLDPGLFAPYPYINIAATGRGTVVRIDVDSGEIVGEYYTGPSGTALGPSRTTVDLEGNVWCGDRVFGNANGGGIVKIGLVIGGTRGDKNPDGSFSPNSTGQYLAPPFVYNTCIDRDGDGLIRTSRGFGNILPWPNITDGAGSPDGQPALVEDAEDEAVLIYQRLPNTPQSRHVSIDSNNDLWVGSMSSGTTFWKLDGITGARIGSFAKASICNRGGYGGFIDAHNVLWSANGNFQDSKLLRYDLNLMTGTCLDAPYSYGLTQDSNGNVWNTMYERNEVRKFTPDGTIVGTYAIGGSGARGLAASPRDNHIWVAASRSNTICRLDNNGQVLKTIAVGANPTGVAVDTNGKVWVTNRDSEDVMRIDPDGGADGLGVLDLTIEIGGEVYNYSDMTGTLAVNATAPSGTWSVIHDAGVVGSRWPAISWSSLEPVNTKIDVAVRATDDLNSLQTISYTDTDNRALLHDVTGQFVQVEATLSRTVSENLTPVLYDLTIEGPADLTASYMRFACGAEPRYVTVRVGNGGAMRVDAGVPVSFYDGDPSTGGPLLGTTFTTFPLRPGVFEDVTLQLPTSFDCSRRVFAVADDLGAVDCTGGTGDRGVIDFEHLPGGVVVQDGQTISDEFEDEFGVRFRLADGSFPVLAKVGSPQTAFQGAEGQPDLPADGTDNGQFFLTDDGVVGGPPPALIIEYVDPVAAASGQILDIDCYGTNPPCESWSIEALGCDGILIASTQLGPKEPDGSASDWHLEGGSEDICTVRIAYTGQKLDGVGLAFDNFAPTGRTCITETIGECNEENNIHSAQIDVIDDRFADATLDVAIDFANTTYNVEQQSLVVQARVQNIGDEPIEDCLLLVIDSIGDAGVRATNPDGYTNDGRPYYVFLEPETAPNTLLPEEFTPFKKMAFYTTDHNAWFEHSVRTCANRPPFFVSFPATSAVIDRPYSYQAEAIDPDGQALEYRLIAAPENMTADRATGLIEWLPTVKDFGSHTIMIEASDPRGGTATQRIALDVTPLPVNRPPVFTSIPVTHVSVGATYEYQATAGDPDGDDLSFVALNPDGLPDGMTVGGDGLVYWEFALPGQYEIALRVTDARGAYADQVYVLTAGDLPANPHSPRLLSTPGTIAVLNREYVYQPVAYDPDPGDILDFTLASFPDGMMIDNATGRTTWTPTADQVGLLHPVVLSVDDGNGGSAAQAWEIEVVQDAPNQPPVIESLPNFISLVNEPYTYQVLATDPEGGRVTFSLFNAQAGMTIGEDTGLIEWMPAVVGPVVVAIKASDPQGAFGAQVYDLDVSPPNDPPRITSTPVESVAVGATYRYQVEAEDPEGDALNYLLRTAPSGMTVGRTTGLITWTSGMDDLGTHPVEVLVTDLYGGSDSQAYDLTVTPDTDPPTVEIIVRTSHVNSSGEPVAFINEPVTICLQTGDNVGVIDKELLVDDTPQVLNSLSCVQLTPDTVGSLVLEASVGDAAGNVGSDARDLPVVDPNDTDAPVIEIISPEPGSTVYAPVDIVASITDTEPANLVWEVRLFRAGLDAHEAMCASPDDRYEYKVIGQGSGEVIEGVVAQLDPTLLANDTYFVEIYASDGVLCYILPVPYSIAGELKLGNFRIAFTDLAIPLAGIPLVITREYDSLDTSVGDFGHGWRLALPGRVNDAPAESPTVETFTTTTRVYVTLPDGRRVGFTSVAIPPSPFFPFIVEVYFRPDAGVYDKLEIFGESTATASGGFLYSGLFSTPFNPNTYLLTTKEGIKYIIDEIEGLQLIEDRNGNTIEVCPDGMFSSTGVAINFVRDAEGRIERIIEPDPDSSDGIAPAQLEYRYNAPGDLTSFRDQLGNTTTFSYLIDPPHYLDNIHDPLGRQAVRVEYDENGRVVAIVDGNGVRHEQDFNTAGSWTSYTDGIGNTTVYFYDERGNIVRQIDALGGITSIEYGDPANPDRETCVTLPGDLTAEFSYDEAGNITRVQDPEGNATLYHFDQFRNLTQLSDPRGNVRSMAYDASGNLMRRVDPLGNSTTYDYDSSGKRVRMIDPLGHETAWTYDAAGNTLTETDALGNAVAWTYDTHGNRTSQTRKVTDANGVERTVATSSRYDAAGRLVETTDADGNVMSQGWNALGKLAWREEANGKRVDYEYDDAGNRVGAVYDDGSIETWSYDSNNKLMEHVDRFGGIQRTDYDALGRKIKEVGVNGSTINHEYDATGREIATTINGVRTESRYGGGWRFNPSAHQTASSGPVWNRESVTTARGTEIYLDNDASGNATAMTVDDVTVALEYDANNRQAGILMPDGRHATIDVDAGGRPTTLKDTTGQSFVHEYDGVGRLVAVVDALGNRTEYAYDEMGNRLSTRDALGRVTRWQYDDKRRAVSKTLPMGQTESYVYGPDDTILSHTDFMGRTTTYEYDTLSRMTRKVYPDGSQVSYTYGANGKRQAMVDARGVTSYEYDPFSRLTRVVQPDGAWIAYTYDEFGRRTAVSTTAGSTLYSYDSSGKLATVTDPSGRVTTYLYGSDGNLASVHYANGVVTEYTTDTLGRTTDIRIADSTQVILSERQYSYNSDGLIEGIAEDSGRHQQFSYDAATHLLTELITEPDGTELLTQYTLDAAANRSSVTKDGTTYNYTYDLNDRMLFDGTHNYTNDDNGNRLSKSDGPNTWLYEYDFENRLRSIVSPDGSVTEYVYDGDGNRVAESHDGQSVIYLIDTTERFAQVLEERDENDEFIARFVYGNSIVSREDSNGVLYFHGDHVNSTILLTDDSGLAVGQYAYDAFGAVHQLSGPSEIVNLFTGERQDAELGQVFLRARYYDPRIGRFLTRDSWEGVSSVPDSLGTYTYGIASPTRYTDPSGRMALSNESILLKRAIRYSRAFLGYGSFSAHALIWVSRALDTDQSAMADVRGFEWTVGISAHGGVIAAAGGVETLAFRDSGVEATYGFLGVAIYATSPPTAAINMEMTHWDYGLGGFGFIPSRLGGRGWAWGVKKPCDYTGWFLGSTVGVTAGKSGVGYAFGGASAPGVVASYVGPMFTYPGSGSLSFFMGGSWTWYTMPGQECPKLD